MAQIRVEALDKSFGTFHAVRSASFTVLLAGVVGYSIAGKLPQS